MKKYLNKKLHRKLLLLRLRPIRVFCFHQVSDEYEPDTMKECDWMQSDVFKQTILALKQKCTFVSLEDAYSHIVYDKFRMKHYVVLTADDGWASLNNILPWLKEQNIPVTLFLNPGYFDGCHFRERKTEEYLLKEDVQRICETYSNVSFGMHGWEHVRATEQSETEFHEGVLKSLKVLQVYPNYKPFYAYTYGSYNDMNSKVLKAFGLVPVLIDGMKNVNDFSCVHRELLDVVTL